MGSSFPVFSLDDNQILKGFQPMRSQYLLSQEAPIVRFWGLRFYTSYVNLWNILLTDLLARLSPLDTCKGTPWCNFKFNGQTNWIYFLKLNIPTFIFIFIFFLGTCDRIKVLLTQIVKLSVSYLHVSMYKESH